MTDQQKQIVRELLRRSYSDGFDHLYPLKPIANEMGITPLDIYDENTETGILWEYGPHGNGFLRFDLGHAGVVVEVRDLLENWSDYRG